MPRILFVLLFFLAISAETRAQNSHDRDQVMLVSGVVINGRINPDAYHLLQNQITFRHEGSRNHIILRPDEVKSFTFAGGAYFESMVLHGRPIFLHCLVKGRFSLYMTSSQKMKKEFFLLNSSQELIPLEETFKMVEWKGKLRKMSNYEYASVLKMAMNDCPAVFQVIDNLKLDEKRLINVFAVYNSCHEGDDWSSEYILEPKPLIDYGLSVAYNPFLFNTRGERFSAGLKVNLKKSGEYKRSSFYTGLNYFYYHAKYDYDRLFDIQAHYISIPVYYCFQSRKGRIVRPYYFFGGDIFILLRGVRNNTDKLGLHFIPIPTPTLGSGIEFNIGKSAVRIELSIESLLAGSPRLVYIF